MADLKYPAGATPLDMDEADGLIPAHISNQGQLNEWEQRNIREGEHWAFRGRRADILSIAYMQQLHRRMFGDTWRWAGRIRKTEKNIGVAPERIQVELKKLCDDVRAQLEHRTWTIDEIAARFHHRLVSIHPFPNGNGRFARTMTDLVLVRNGSARFTWGRSDLIADGEIRQRYISALRAADGRDYAPLLAFVRS
jgi:Fic-DOC domain mobile mystery protein B